MTGDQRDRIPTVPEEERLLGVDDVAERLGLSVHTVKRLPSDELAYFRINSRGDRRYRLGDVRAYLAARRVG